MEKSEDMNKTGFEENDEATTPHNGEHIPGGSKAVKSVLTFNASVVDKNVVTVIKEPFQIMPSTRNYLTDATISKYPESGNENLLIHMNYITKPFGDNAIESNSRVRYSLRQYCKLVQQLKTKDVLIHMPSNLNELRNLTQGLSVINDELCSHGVHVHLEIACWSMELANELKVNQSNAVECVSKFIDTILTRCARYGGKFSIVLDTAHLLANGCSAEKQMILFDKYRNHMKYAHLNGNLNGMFTSDSHVPIWHTKSRLVDFQTLSRHVSGLGLICVAEITKAGDNYDRWKQFSDSMGFELVNPHPAFST